MEGKTVLALMLFGIIACLNAAPTANADVECPVRQGMKEFNFARFAGRWYGKIVINPKGGTVLKCYQEKFTPIPKQNNYTIINAYIANPRTGQEKSLNGTSLMAPNSTEGKLTTVLTVSRAQNLTRTDYILNTDYSNYAILLTCARANIGYAETYWVYTRRPLIENVYLQKIFDALKSMGWNLYSVQWVEQTCGALRWTPDEAN